MGKARPTTRHKMALSLKPADVVADIGAGTGYFSFRIAPLVPQGKVIAVDIQPEMLTLLTNKIDLTARREAIATSGNICRPGLCVYAAAGIIPISPLPSAKARAQPEGIV